MSEVVAPLLQSARDWFAAASAAGWIPAGEQARYAALECATPAELFADDALRPLVVAFFGGTGVGKSSLLNRLAGQSVARTGVERPTSREITVYLHADARLAKLPAPLPVEQVRVVRHSNDAARGVMWVDAPDIDSVEAANRELALHWLPHVDLLVYVVSPERYRDDVGWRVLRERGGRHGWMFVMNRWDEGDASQRTDFLRLLNEAGFAEPMLFCTTCAPRAEWLPSPDEFDEIARSIERLLGEHGLRELERVGAGARLGEVREALQRAAAHLGGHDAWDACELACVEHWRKARVAIEEGAHGPLATLSRRFAVRESGLIDRFADAAGGGSLLRMLSGRKSVPEGDAAPQRDTFDPRELALKISEEVWDAWMQADVDDVVDACEVEAKRRGLPAARVRGEIEAAMAGAGKDVTASVRSSLRAALSKPVSGWRRRARWLAAGACWVLPLLALTWVGFNVVLGYSRATFGAAEYLGGPFAINSALLVLIAWLGPFVAERALRPSAEKTALRGMRAGLSAGLDGLTAHVSDALTEVRADADRVREEARAIATRIGKRVGSRSAAGGIVDRMVAGDAVASR